MIEEPLRQRLHDLLAPYGVVRSLRVLGGGGGDCLVLATMENAACTLAAQAALGLHSFGTDSLLVTERWLRDAVSGA